MLNINVGVRTLQIAAFLEGFPFLGIEGRDGMMRDSLDWAVKEVFRNADPPKILELLERYGFSDEVIIKHGFYLKFTCKRKKVRFTVS